MSQMPNIENLKEIIRKNPTANWVEKIMKSELAPSIKEELLDFVNPAKKNILDALMVDGDTNDIFN